MEKQNNEQLNMFMLSDLYCASYSIKEQYKQYIDYKNNRTYDEHMEVIYLLEELGYPIEKIGIYFYKEMIIKIVQYLENIENKAGFKKYHKLLDELDNHYSSFYFDVARNELDVGIKTFHEVLKNQILNINHSNANPEKFDEVFGSIEINNLGYEEKAFVISSYLYLNKKNKKEKNNIKVSMHK